MPRHERIRPPREPHQGRPSQNKTDDHDASPIHRSDAGHRRAGGSPDRAASGPGAEPDLPQELTRPGEVAQPPEGVSRERDAKNWTLTWTPVATIGTGIRTSGQRSTLKPGGGNNGDDSDLNYAAGDAFSRVVKLNSEFKAVHRSGLGVELDGYAWYDDAQLNGNVAHGNNPSNYQPNAPLSDRGFARGARFQGAQVLGAYVFGTAAIGDGSADFKIGKLSLERERGFSFSGGSRDLETRTPPQPRVPARWPTRARSRSGPRPRAGTSRRRSSSRPSCSSSPRAQCRRAAAPSPRCWTSPPRLRPRVLQQRAERAAERRPRHLHRARPGHRAQEPTGSIRPGRELRGARDRHPLRRAGREVPLARRLRERAQGHGPGPAAGATYQIEHPADKSC
ncbi:hypothetical protein Ddc_22171 [Ditylenchus destructor]|nr:hypothetical protein Ddc_22171 [Ditylenchus destructor]